MSNRSTAGGSGPERWGSFVAKQRFAVAGGCVGVLVVLLVLWHAFGAPFQNTFNLPGTETQQASDLLAARFPQLSGDTARIAFAADAGVKDPSIQPRIQAVLDQAGKLQHVVGVGSPFNGAGSGGAISQDGKTAYAVV